MLRAGPLRSSKTCNGKPSPGVRLLHPAIYVEDVARALGRANRGGKEHNRLGHVLGEDVHFESGALSVVFLQLVRGYPVGLRPFPPPPPGSAPGAARLPWPWSRPRRSSRRPKRSWRPQRPSFPLCFAP